MSCVRTEAEDQADWVTELQQPVTAVEVGGGGPCRRVITAVDASRKPTLHRHTPLPMPACPVTCSGKWRASHGAMWPGFVNLPWPQGS